MSQSDLIGDVNKELEPSVFNNFVPNYKSLANIYKMFSDNTDPKSAVILEQMVLEHMCQPSEEEVQTEVDSLVVESFVQKFNNKYNENSCRNKRNCLTFILVLLLTTLWN